jgi:hypothetical protein
MRRFDGQEYFDKRIQLQQELGRLQPIAVEDLERTVEDLCEFFYVKGKWW